MMIIKREGFPDITDEDLQPIDGMKIEMTPIEPVRHAWKGPKPEVLPDLMAGEFRTVERVGVGFINPRGLAGRHITVLVGDKENDNA